MGNRTATVWGVCHVACFRWGEVTWVKWFGSAMLRLGKSKPANAKRGRERGHVDGGWWVTRMCGMWTRGHVRWYCYRYVSRIGGEEDIYSLCMAQKEMWHYNRGLVLCLVCTHQLFASSWKIGCLHFIIFLFYNSAIGNVEGKTMVKYSKKKKKKIMWWRDICKS